MSVHTEASQSPMNEIDMDVLIHSSVLCGKVYEMPVDVYISWRDKTKYIAIEGSDTLIDWYDNASFLLRKNDIHRGFYRYAKYCMKQYKLLEELNDTNASEIVITGHSLGAACVVIVMAELCKLLNVDIPRSVILFGCPQVGGRRFMSRFQKDVLNDHDLAIKCTSLKNGEDIVCHNPPGVFGYTNTEPLIYIDPCIADETRTNKMKNNGIYDHMIGQYCKTLTAYQKQNRKLPPKKVNDKGSFKPKRFAWKCLYAAIVYKTTKGFTSFASKIKNQNNQKSIIKKIDYSRAPDAQKTLKTLI
jgi:hypothetical protein